jgi:hypothetical protein
LVVVVVVGDLASIEEGITGLGHPIVHLDVDGQPVE